MKIIGEIYREYRFNDPYGALGYAEQGFELARKLDDKWEMANGYGRMGLCHMLNGNYDMALKNYLKSKGSYEQLGMRDGVAERLANIANIYSGIGNYEKSTEYNKQAIRLYQEIGDISGVAYARSNMGDSYLDLGDYEKALNCFQKSLKIHEKLEDQYAVAHGLKNIGRVYQHEENYELAMRYYMRSLRMAEEIKNRQTITLTLNRIGNLCLIQRNYSSAIEYFNNCLKIAVEKTINKDSYYGLSEANAQQGNYQQALKYYQRFTQAKDSLYNEDKAKEIGKLEARYEFEKAEEERKQLEEEKMREQTAMRARSDNLQYSGILIFIALFFTERKHGDITTINAGISGSDIIYQWVLLKEKLVELNPDLLIFEINTSDIIDVIVRGGMERYIGDSIVTFKDPPFFEPFYAASFIFRHVLHDVFDYGFLLVPADEMEGEQLKAIDLINRVLLEIKGYTDQRGIKFLLVLNPWEVDITNKAYSIRNFSEITKGIKDISLDLLQYYLSTNSINEENSFEYYWEIDLHYKPKGYWQMGETIASEIDKRYLE